MNDDLKSLNKDNKAKLNFSKDTKNTMDYKSIPTIDTTHMDNFDPTPRNSYTPNSFANDMNANNNYQNMLNPPNDNHHTNHNNSNHVYENTNLHNVTTVTQQHSVLWKQSLTTLPIILISYVILQTLAGYFNTVCNEPYQLEFWVRHVNLATMIWYGMHIIYNIYQMICEYEHWKSSEAFSAYAHGLAVLFIVQTSTFLSVAPHTSWSPCCRDAFGVISRVPQWPEWITTVPLLFYIAISCDNNKEYLNHIDSFMIFCIFLTILTGYILNLHFQSIFINYLLLAMSCGSLAAIIYLAVNAQYDIDQQIREHEWSKRRNISASWDPSNTSWNNSAKTFFADSNGDNNNLNKGNTTAADVSNKARNLAHDRLQLLENKFSKLNIALKKRNLAIVCLFGLPLFPLVYFLSFFQLINDEWSVTLFAVIGLFFKSIMVGLLVAGHISLYEDMRYEQTAGAIKRDLKESKKFIGFSENKFYKTNFQMKSVLHIVGVDGSSIITNGGVGNQHNHHHHYNSTTNHNHYNINGRIDEGSDESSHISSHRSSNTLYTTNSTTPSNNTNYEHKYLSGGHLTTNTNNTNNNNNLTTNNHRRSFHRKSNSNSSNKLNLSSHTNSNSPSSKNNKSDSSSSSSSSLFSKPSSSQHLPMLAVPLFTSSSSSSSLQQLQLYEQNNHRQQQLQQQLQLHAQKQQQQDEQEGERGGEGKSSTPYQHPYTLAKPSMQTTALQTFNHYTPPPPISTAASATSATGITSTSTTTIPNPFARNTFKIVTSPVNPLTIKNSTGLIKNLTSSGSHNNNHNSNSSSSSSSGNSGSGGRGKTSSPVRSATKLDNNNNQQQSSSSSSSNRHISGNNSNSSSNSNKDEDQQQMTHQVFDSYGYNI